MAGKTGVPAHNREDLTGQRFGKLVVERFLETRKGHAYWECKCDCGNRHEVTTLALKSGSTKSCGCMKYSGAARRADSIIGHRFGRLVVLGRAGRTQNGKVLWKCQCDCGNITYGIRDHLGRDKNSCGCIRSEVSRERSYRHGERRTRLYNLWCSMKQRCSERAPEKTTYYDRGIKVCDEWQEFIPFRDWALSHGYDATAPRGTTTIDRIDNNKGYSPNNCRFVTQTENSRNKTTNRHLLVDGEDMILKVAADKYGINYGTLQGRLDRGWTDEDAVKIPVRKGRFIHDGNKRIANY